jgi:hypothetical protein
MKKCPKYNDYEFAWCLYCKDGDCKRNLGLTKEQAEMVDYLKNRPNRRKQNGS